MIEEDPCVGDLEEIKAESRQIVNSVNSDQEKFKEIVEALKEDTEFARTVEGLEQQFPKASDTPIFDGLAKKHGLDRDFLRRFTDDQERGNDDNAQRSM
mgnify:CR=1 FL=1